MKMRKLLSGLLAVCMLLTLLPVAAFAQEPETQAPETAPGGYTARQIENPGVDLKQNLDKVNLPLVNETKRDEKEVVSAIVSLKGDGLLAQGYSIEEVAQLSSAVVDETAQMKAQQDSVLREISDLLHGTFGQAELMGLDEGEELVPEFRYTAGLNGFAVDVPYGLLDDIGNLDAVEDVHEACVFSVPEDMSQTGNETYMYKTQETFGTAQTWNDLGYTGKGMRIAIIDTGLDMDHPSFAADPPEPSMTATSLTQEQVENLAAFDAYSQTSAVRLTPDKLYRSAKVPFAFNYADKSLDTDHLNDNQGDHGTHVAGIAAANRLDTTDVVGVAPDAQILVMKVFGRGEGGAGEGAVLAAVEDSIKLDVDVLNLSLGSPAGYTMESQTIERVYSQILNHGMIAAIAAGNSYSAAYGNGYLGTDRNETRDPDNGVVSSPGTYTGATMVASVDNLTEKLPYFTAEGDTKLAYNCISDPKLDTLGGQSLEYVMVPGYGRVEDYVGIDVSGKVAVVQRGGGQDATFYVKITNAYQKNAVACLVYDNVEGPFINMDQKDAVTGAILKLPNGFITKASGAKLAELAGDDGVGTLTFAPEGELGEFALYTAGEMSDFSSWGVTPDLQLAPDVTAPGGQIYSTVKDGKYDTYGGTSMASPHIAGMAAIVLQYLSDKYPELDNDPAQKHIVAEALIMSTAVPIFDPDGVLYSPRKQGAGCANVYSAVTSPAYLTSHQESTGEETPKASLGDDPEKTGEYTFNFTIHNMGDAPLTYSLEASLLTDQVTTINGMKFMGETGRNLSGKVSFQTVASLSPAYDVNEDGVSDLQDVQALLDHVNNVYTLSEDTAARFDLTADDKVDTADAQAIFEAVSAGSTDVQEVTVPAKGGITVKASVLLSKGDKTYMDKNYENGIYVDGFVRCLAASEDAKDLSLPFVGFYGDWSDARIFDEGFMHSDDLSTDGVLECPYQRYPNSFYVGVGDTGVWELGVNPYVTEDYDPEHNVLSPNGDTYLDSFYDIYLGLMRNSMVTTFTWTDSEGNELFYDWFGFARKSFYLVNYGVGYPMQYTEQCQNYDFNAAVANGTLKNGDHVTLTIQGYLDDGDMEPSQVGSATRPDPAWADDTMVIPVVIDTEAPVITNVDDLGFTVNEDGRTILTIDVSDNYDIAAVVPMTLGGEAYEYIHVDTKTEGVDGETDTIELDVTDYDGTFQIALCDYGMNETYYEITNQAPSKLDAGKFYGYRRYASFVENGVSYATDQYNGWHSFETATAMTMHTNQSQSEEPAVAAAEYVDGFIIGVDVDSKIFAMKAGDWKRIEIGELIDNDDYRSALDMAYDYKNNKLYVLTDERTVINYDDTVEIEPAVLLEVSLEYGYAESSVVGYLDSASGVKTDRSQLLTLACDNDGNIYSIDYDTGALHTITVGDYNEDTEAYDLHVAPVKEDENGNAVGTGYNPAQYSQSMTFDHETGKLYWAAYQGSVGRSYFFELDPATGAIVGDASTSVEMNSEMVGLFKPYTPETPIFEVTEGYPMMNQETLIMRPGESITLAYHSDPFYGTVSSEAVWSVVDPETYEDGSSVATVNQLGMVTAVSEGSVMVVAATDEGEAYCLVNVVDFDGALLAYDNSTTAASSTAQSWLMMNADDPTHALQITDAGGAGIVAAAYQGGGVFAIGRTVKTETVDVDGEEFTQETILHTLYRLNGSLQVEYSVALDDFTVTDGDGFIPQAMSFDYKTGALYVLAHPMSGGWGRTMYELFALNPITGELMDVTTVAAGFGGGGFSQVAGPLEELAAETPLGDEAPAEAMTTEEETVPEPETPEITLSSTSAMTMDYEGNFYILGESVNIEADTSNFAIVKGTLAEQDGATEMKFTDVYLVPFDMMGMELALNPESDSAMVWSESNGCLFVSNDDHLYQVTLPTVSGEFFQALDLGSFAKDDYGTNLGLVAVIDPANEPELPEVLPEDVTAAQDAYAVVEGLTVQVKLNPTPWNATCEATYEIADATVATVDQNGVVTGVKEGRTTLNITVQGKDGEIKVDPVQIVVTPDMGSVFGFVTNTYSSQGTLPADSWARVPLSNPTGVSFISSYLGSFSIYAGAYNGKDGYVYAYGQSDKDYGYYLLKIDPNGYSYSILAQHDYLVRDMAFDFTTGTLFAVAQDQAIAGGLFQVNTKTGEMTLVKDLKEELATVAVDDKGVLYVITAAGNLCTVDKNSGENLKVVKDLGMTAGPLYQSMTYDYNNDKLYWTHDSGHAGALYMIDQNSEDHTLTPLGMMDTGDGDGSMAGSVAVTSLYSAPETEVEIPTTVDPAGVRVTEKTYVEVGKTVKLNATVLPVSVANVEQTVTWESSDPTKATVNESGVVTGLAAGAVTITAKDAQGHTDKCAVQVLAEPRSFYGYDQLKASWVKFDGEGKATVVKADGEGVSPIAAATYNYNTKTLYAYDADGYFYTVDTTTFERSEAKNGVHGLTTPLKGITEWKGQEHTADVSFTVVDMTFDPDPDTNDLYALLIADYDTPYNRDVCAKIVKVDKANGSIAGEVATYVVPEAGDATIPANLLFYNGNLYFVDGFVSGQLTRVSLDGDTLPYAIFADYWGEYVGGRSMIVDEYTGKIYAVRDTLTEFFNRSRSKSTLCEIGLGNANATELYDLGQNTIITSLFLK